MIDQDPRCLSSCEVVPGTLKRCIRATGHNEKHVWVEALNRSEGDPQLVQWDDQRKTITAEITRTVTSMYHLPEWDSETMVNFGAPSYIGVGPISMSKEMWASLGYPRRLTIGTRLQSDDTSTLRD